MSFFPTVHIEACRARQEEPPNVAKAERNWKGVKSLAWGEEKESMEAYGQQKMTIISHRGRRIFQSISNQVNYTP